MALTAVVTMLEALKKLPLNFQLLGNPFNWLTIFLMITIASMGFAMLTTQLKNKDDISNG